MAHSADSNDLRLPCGTALIRLKRFGGRIPHTILNSIRQLVAGQTRYWTFGTFKPPKSVHTFLFNLFVVQRPFPKIQLPLEYNPGLWLNNKSATPLILRFRNPYISRCSTSWYHTDSSFRYLTSQAYIPCFPSEVVRMVNYSTNDQVASVANKPLRLTDLICKLFPVLWLLDSVPQL